MRHGYSKHSDDFRRYFYLTLLFLSPLSLIFGIWATIDYFSSSNQANPVLPFPLMALLSAGGLIGTVILSYIIVNTLIELNDEHKWFTLKRDKK